jgi:hypothetical protein
MSISRRRSEEGKNNENSYPAAPLRRRVSFSLPRLGQYGTFVAKLPPP